MPSIQASPVIYLTSNHPHNILPATLYRIARYFTGQITVVIVASERPRWPIETRNYLSSAKSPSLLSCFGPPYVPDKYFNCTWPEIRWNNTTVARVFQVLPAFCPPRGFIFHRSVTWLAERTGRPHREKTNIRSGKMKIRKHCAGSTVRGEE